MTSHLFIVGTIALIIGCLIGWALWWWNNRETKEMQKILNDPELLIKKLTAHGKIYDEGCPITISLKTNKDGKKVIDVEKGEEIKAKTKVLPKPIKAKTPEKKKVKKKSRKGK